MSQKGGDMPTRDQLIKSIRIIKGQRQRANLVRIIKSLKNHHNIHAVNEKGVTSILEAAVNDGLLTKAWKNDEVAYQEYVQSMPKLYKGPKKSQLYAAIQQVINRSNDENGLPLKTICEEMKNTDLCRSMNPVLLKYTIKICCLKMVTRELLVRNGNCFKIGNYGCMANSGEEDEEICITDKAVSDKRPATPIEICSFCMDQNKTDEDGEVEELIYCVECGRGGHPSCLQFSKKLTDKVKTLRWQCIECKKCSICAEVTRPDSMLFCDFCDRGFHMDCCKPPIQRPPKGQWSCCICEFEKSQRSKNVRFLKREGGGFNFRKSSGGLRKYMKKQFLHSFKGKHRSKYGSYDDDANILAYESKLFKKTADEIKSISDEDKELFKRCQTEVKEKLYSNVSVAHNQHRRPLPTEIFIGDYRVNTWYSSPYPNGFGKLPQLHICEFCLTFVETEDILSRHATRCHLKHPPGNEIYRDGEHSVFEVDGNEAKIYSQNLCLLAKLFLDHKTLYFDVEPFLFYVVTINDASGCHFIGYFSKEKYCQQKYNLSCIMTLPQYQRFGYGGFLIDFSYALSRKEGVSGTPEKPLSDLGQLSYQSYWLSVVVEEINKNKDKSISVKGISEATGLDKQDTLSTLMQHRLLQENNGRLKIMINSDLLVKYENKKRRRVNEDFLQWTPYTVTLPEVEEEQVKNDEDENERKLKSPGRCQNNYLNRRSPLKSRNKDMTTSIDANRIKGKQDDQHQPSPITSTPLNKKFKLGDESMFASCDVSNINQDLESETPQPKKRGRPKTKNTSRWLFDAITPIRPDDKIDDPRDDESRASDPEETLPTQETSKTIDCSPEIHMVDMGVEEEHTEVVENGESCYGEADMQLSLDCTSQHVFEPI